MRALGEVWRCANLYRTGTYGELGLGSYQDSYILNICRQPGITQEQLSRLIYVHKSSVARQLGALEEKGFITRTPDPDDKRSLLVYQRRRLWTRCPLSARYMQSGTLLYFRALARRSKRILKNM